MARERPLPPQPTGGRPCSWGGGGDRSTGWRWSRGLGAWLPVCDGCSGGQRAFTAGDYVPDWANVPRQEGTADD